MTKPDVLRTFIENFTMQICWKYITSMKKIVHQGYSEKNIPMNWVILVLGMKISKTRLPEHTGYLQDRP